MTLIESDNGKVVKGAQLLVSRCRAASMGVTLLTLLILAALPDTSLLAQATPETWSVTERPLLRIGIVNGPEEYLFQSIAGIVALPEGRLAVADAGHLTVRVYDAGGRHLYRMGGRGAGPGEFFSIFGLWVTEDGELAVWDDETRQITRFSQAGVHVETKRIVHDDAVMGNLQVFYGPLSDGEVLLGALTTPVRRPGESSPNTFLLYRYHLSGELRAAVGHMEGIWTYSNPPSSAPLPFTPVPWAVTWNDTIYVAAGYAPGIEVRDRHGTRVRTLAVPGKRAANRSDWAAFRRVLRERADDLPVGPFLVNFLERFGMPLEDDRMPAVAGLLVDDAGLIWAKAFRPAEDSGWLRARVMPPAPGGEWWVLDPARGVTVARVEMPASVLPLAVREGDIIGKDVDQLGVERVVVHELRRGASRR